MVEAQRMLNGLKPYEIESRESMVGHVRRYLKATSANSDERFIKNVLNAMRVVDRRYFVRNVEMHSSIQRCKSVQARLYHNHPL